MSKEADQTVMTEKSKMESDGEVQYHEHVEIKPQGKAVNALLVATCTVFAAASFLFGFDDKVISPIVALEPFVDKYQGPNPTTGKLVFTARNQNLLFAVPLVGSILGALAAYPLNNRFGRKWPLVGSYFISIGGCFLQLFAPNLGGFIAGRFWNAFVMGVANATAPLYLGETVPVAIRGRVVASINIMNLLAGVVATLVVYGTHARPDKLSYMVPLAVQCCLPVVLIPLTAFLPESPQWLIGKGRLDEAFASLRKLRGYSDAEVRDELRVMKACEDNERNTALEVSFWSIFDRDNLKRTVTAGSFFSFNQCSGVFLSTTYATVFLVDIGVASPFALTIIASCCTLAGTMVAPLLIDRLGRRPLALAGMAMLLAIDVAAGGLAFDMGDKSKVLGIAALSFIFNFFWASSFYSLSNVMPTEIATIKLRSYTMSYTIAWAQTTAVITTIAVPQLTAADGANLGAKTYLIFAGCMVGIILFVFFLMPETKNRTFAEIDEIYDAKVPMWRWAEYQTTTEAKQAKDLPVDVVAKVLEE
ncbi:hypothetical protein SLS54_009593 [Diplodia seriata]